MTAGDTSRAAASSRCDQPGGVQPGDELLPAPGPQAEAHIAAGQPVISVDGKKKELVGNFSNGGRDYRPVGKPVQTNIYDFKGELGKVTPHGVYDMAANTGWVSVGSDHDTGQFAVESIRRWWDKVGRLSYPTADRLLITADGGGDSARRPRRASRPERW
jgi:hypothetical protein